MVSFFVYGMNKKLAWMSCSLKELIVTLCPVVGSFSSRFVGLKPPEELESIGGALHPGETQAGGETARGVKLALRISLPHVDTPAGVVSPVGCDLELSPGEGGGDEYQRENEAKCFHDHLLRI